MKVTARPRRPGQLRRALDDASSRASRELADALQEAGDAAEGEVRERAPLGPTGNFAAGIRTEADGRHSAVGTTAPHRHLVEKGRSPGPMPPVAKIAFLFNIPKERAFTVARAIGRRGTAGHHVFEQAFDAAQPEVRRIARDAARRIGRLR